MDLDLLKTFLEVNRTRHFGKAAENLYLTQSAVSARIRQLEDTLGVPLFVRLRKDIRLTSAGNRLIKHAELILNTWHRARQDVALGGEDKTLLVIGGLYSLWDILLQAWVQDLSVHLNNTALQAEVHSSDTLVHKLIDGTLDLALTFDAPQMAELVSIEVGSIPLQLVSSMSGLSAQQAVAKNYLFVEWGTAYAITHARYFPDMPPPMMRMGMGRMALAYILGQGGSAYLAQPMVSEMLERKQLYAVADAPVIDRSVHAVYQHQSERRKLVEQALTYFAGQGLGARAPAALAH